MGNPSASGEKVDGEDGGFELKNDELDERYEGVGLKGAGFMETIDEPYGAYTASLRSGGGGECFEDEALALPWLFAVVGEADLEAKLLSIGCMLSLRLFDEFVCGAGDTDNVDAK